MGQLVSFREFIVTGRLGPLHTSMRPAEVADALGTPACWILNEGVNWPEYWEYGNHLEISFDSSTGNMWFFQIERAKSLKGDFFRLNDARNWTETAYGVVLDGFHGYSKPSDFLKISVAAGLATEIHLSIEQFNNDMWISIGTSIVIIYSAVGCEHWPSIAQRARQMVSARGLSIRDTAQLLMAVDDMMQLDSIYAHRIKPVVETSTFMPLRFDGEHYLRAIADGEWT